MKRLLICFFFFGTLCSSAQEPGSLTVEKIMRDPKWMGVSPSDIQWDLNSHNVYFNWNPDKLNEDLLYQISIDKRQPVKSAEEPDKTLSKNSVNYSKDRSKVLFERNGDLFLLTLASGKETALTKTIDRESNPVFSKNESKILFQRGENLFSMGLNDGTLIQLSNFSRVRKRADAQLSKQDQWLRKDQISEFDIIKKREEDRKKNEQKSKLNAVKVPKEFYLDERSMLLGLNMSPDEKYIAFRIMKRAEGNKNTIVPNYVTSSGYTEDINGRTKVGNTLSESESFIYDLQRDTIYAILTKEIPGIKDLPDYVKDYPKQLE